MQRLQVSTKLIGVIGVVVVVASAAVGVFVFRGAETALRTQTRAQLEAERVSRGRLVSGYFNRLRDQMRISSKQLVTQIALREMRAAPATSPAYERVHALFHPYARGLVEAFAHPDIVLAGVDGAVQYSYAGQIRRGANLCNAPLVDSGAGEAFARAASASIDAVQFVDYQPFAPAGGAPAGFAATPVFDADGTSRLGILIFRIAPDELTAIMTDAAGFGDTGETYLLGTDLLMRTNGRFASDDTVLKRAIQTGAGRRAIAGETGTIEQIDYRGVPVIAAFAPIDVLGVRWAIVAKIDIDEALAPARLFQSRLLILLGVVGLVAGLVLWEALRRIVLSPVASLAAGARRVAATNYAQPVGLTSRDELGQLGRAFDTMMASVGAHVDELHRARAAAQLGQQLLEAAPDGVVVANAQGRITVVNAAAERLFGYTRDELIGQNIEVLVPDASRSRHIGHRQMYLSGPATRGMGIGLELEGRRKDGSQVPVEISLSPLQSSDGLLVVAAVRDISERRAAERQIKESEERLAAAARGANLGLWDVDARASGVLTNAIFESQLSYAPLTLRESDAKWAPLRGGLEAWVELLHDDDRERVAGLITRFLSGDGDVYRAEHRVRKPDGSYAWILSVGSSMERDSAGKPLRVNGVHIDISEMKNLEALRDGLVHMIVHDLRSPLNGVMGFIDLLREDGTATPQTRAHYASQAYDSAAEMAELISTLLDINRLEASEMPVDRQPVDLDTIASEAIRSLGGLVVGRNVTHPPAASPVISNCDAGLIRRVIGNLLGNALKFTPESGAIRVSVSRANGRSRVEVTDSGPGIPADFIPRVFDKFSQSGEGRARKRYSTGLGLAFCKLAVEAHAGTIGVSSAVGIGSTFWFELPE